MPAINVIIMHINNCQIFGNSFVFSIALAIIWTLTVDIDKIAIIKNIKKCLDSTFFPEYTFLNPSIIMSITFIIPLFHMFLKPHNPR